MNKNYNVVLIVFFISSGPFDTVSCRLLGDAHGGVLQINGAPEFADYTAVAM